VKVWPKDLAASCDMKRKNMRGSVIVPPAAVTSLV